MQDLRLYDSPRDQTTFQRFEAKYIITETEAACVLDYLSPWLESDRHTKRGVSYDINSLYLDSEKLGLYWSSALGEKNRMKLRIRAYSEESDAPVFLEIKRRVNQVILKQRTRLRREAMRDLLAGKTLDAGALAHPTERERDNYYAFRDCLEHICARPAAFVRYDREAYVSRLEEPVRVTFDRNLCCLPCDHYAEDMWKKNTDWLPVDAASVILEIKFTNAFPAYVARVVQRFGLRQTSFAKYVHCMNALQRRGALAGILPGINEDIMWSADYHDE
ncbi:MAG: VTC domain-containing protein [Candidatus Sumerlaeia bacterium]